MRLIKPSYEIWEQESGLEGIYKMIEKVGRVCYKSEDKIAEGTAKPFVDRLMKSGHGAMLEHGTVYLRSSYDISVIGGWRHSIGYKYSSNPYSRVTIDENADFRGIYVTTNLRVLVKNGWLDDLKYLCEPTEYHTKRVTVHFVCDRGVSHEFVRHRTFSFAQESTRYCNYSKDKFGNELTFIIPNWFNIPEGSYEPWMFAGFNLEDNKRWSALAGNEKNFNGIQIFFNQISCASDNYGELIHYGFTPQEARAVLPNALKTELVMTGFVDESGWINFFNLRALGTTGAPHPQAKELAEPLFEEFKAKGLIK